MKHNVYSIFDTASGLYSRPFFDGSDASAMRNFSDIAQDAEHPVGQHPEDYTLIRVGIWDDNNGELTDETNSSLATGLESVAQSRKITPIVQPKTAELIHEQYSKDLKAGLTD